MARLQLSKAALTKETANLTIYQQFLPSLELKRQELMNQRAKARQAIARTESSLQQINLLIEQQIPMLSNEQVDLNNLVQITHVEIKTENIMGVQIPGLAELDINIRDYSFLAKPHWVDAVAVQLKAFLVLKISLQVEQERLIRLESAVRTITQRVNLFEKVLIPKSQENIKRIRIHLSDTERAAVVIAKLAKSKPQRVAAR